MCKLSSVRDQREQPPTRRARLRAETSREIKAIALEHAATGGPEAISLRAIARDMGMTAGAIYSYFPTRDDLVTVLINEVYEALTDAMETVLASIPPEDAARRILAWGEAFRDWSLANPAGFKLIYGDAVSGYRAPEGGAAPESEHRACTIVTGLVSAAWPQAAAAQTCDSHEWSDFGAALVAAVRRDYPELPPSGVALALRLWGRTHGLVSLEVYGHLGAMVHDPGPVYRAELLDMIRSMGLRPPE